MGRGEIHEKFAKEGTALPKVVLSQKAEQQKKRCNYIAGMLKGGMRQKCLTIRDISEKTGISERTVRNHLNYPESTKLSDLYKLADVVGVSIAFSFKETPD